MTSDLLGAAIALSFMFVLLLIWRAAEWDVPVLTMLRMVGRLTTTRIGGWDEQIGRWRDEYAEKHRQEKP